jgi:hypothetical protein
VRKLGRRKLSGGLAESGGAVIGWPILLWIKAGA